MTSQESSVPSLITIILWTFGASLVLLCISGFFFDSGLGVVVYFLLGWIFFLVRVIPQLQFDWNGTLTAVVCLFFLGVIVHYFARWLYHQVRKAKHGESASPREWQVRWTAGILLVLVFMFIAGISAVGVTHQTGWLITSPEPILTYGSVRQAAATMQSQNNLKQIGFAAHTYHDANEALPPGALFDDEGRALHGWQTQLLPYVEQRKLYEQIKLDLPWNHPDNRKSFETSVSVYLHPETEPVTKNDYAVGSYAGNVHVLGGNQKLKLKDIETADGTSNTLYCGEALSNPRPWGYPQNWRDPGLGLNRHPGGFSGSEHAKGVSFSFTDGSVRMLNSDISQDVLKALATPDGGEPVAEFAD